ncbi:MAG TPA: neutral/alkaline non-lysosomal ceramidase N-terminal domain-containing protein [Clostridiales bacterium]|nr:neutral/alkaline non-lysosomal ceramidase N-terminal domain-containing protein [Clostridiales bacterium]
MRYIKIGVAESDIELITGMDMTGYLARMFPSEGIHDALKIKCIVFDDDKNQFVLIICDLLGLDSEYIKECNTEISKKLSISSDNIVIACIHTHSGPASIFLQDSGAVDYKWLESLKLRIVECACKAAYRMRSSKIIYKTSNCNIGINRVMWDVSNPELFVDDQLGVLEIRDAGSGCIDTVLVNYACHPVVLGDANLFYSKDYPHFLIHALNRRDDYKNASIIFANGCCGDINPSEKGNFEIADKLGKRLADSVADTAIIQLDENVFSNAKIKVKTLRVSIPLKNEAGDVLKEPKSENSDEVETQDNEIIIKVKKAMKNWGVRMRSKNSSGTLEYAVAADIKIICIGMLRIVTLPFEVFHEIGIKIKEFFGTDRTIVLGYANGDYGYLPSKALYEKAGYEAGTAFKYYGFPGPVCKDAEDIVLKAIFDAAIEGGLIEKA